ncbi:MAG TPA: DMT family transporter, partial [Castellaniella sp.]|nr:DMT family transporter [Castellaniella sp.]
LRSAVAVVFVALLIRWRGERIDWASGTWRPGILVGILFGFEYLLVGEGLRFTTASHMSVFLYTAPIFAALGLQWKLPAERLGAVQWAGILMAFLGIVVTFYDRGPAAAGFSTDLLIGDLMGLLAGATWGATTVVLRCTRLANTPTTHTLIYQLLGASVILVAAAVLSGQTQVQLTPMVVLSMGYQIFLMAFGSLLLWFWLLRTYLASRLGVLSFMSPLFGVGFGVWLLDDPMDPGFVIGAALVLCGIFLVSGHEWLASHWRARSAGKS